MKRRHLYSIPAFLVSFLLIIPSQISSGIPAFARKYQISCQVCHSPVPRLKPFGEDFAGDGYRMTKYESPRYFIDAGDEKLSLLRELPLAIRFDGIVSADFRDNGKVDFGTPFGLKIMSGGELSDKLSYYFYFFMSEAGSLVGVEDAFLMYHDLLGTGVNLTLGQFQVCDPLYKRELRLTLEDARILTVVPGNSTASLTYDRGLIIDYEIPKLKTQFVVEILNGSGIGSAGEELIFDKDQNKNVMGIISQPIGKFLKLGVFGYDGWEQNLDPSVSAVFNNNTRIFGPSLNLDINEKLLVNIHYAKRFDSRVYLMDEIKVVDNIMTQGGFAEIIYCPKGDKSKWYLTSLLNWVNSDLPDLDYKSATLHAGYVLRRNVRLFSEYTVFSDGNGKLGLGFVSAF
jgi:hypothetical protein